MHDGNVRLSRRRFLALAGRAPADLMRRGWDGFVRVSHEEAYALHAKALLDVARTYSGEPGSKYLRAQGYDPAMVEALGGCGVRATKFRGGMAKLGATRITGTYRFGNMLALLDAHVRGVGPDEAAGGGSWDSYSWHTDLPPGHPVVHGDQTPDFELFDAENANLLLVWGMNWIATKMPDSHWMTEARLKGTKVVIVTVEYSATANKADEVIVIRPGTDPAFALGLASVIVREGLYDADFVRRFTDLPALVRMDTLAPLLARDAFPGHVDAEPTNWATVLKKGEAAPPTAVQKGMQIPDALRGEFADVVMWDRRRNGPAPVGRDQVGDRFAATSPRPGARGDVSGQAGGRPNGRGAAGLRPPRAVPDGELRPRGGLEDHLGAEGGRRQPRPADRREHGDVVFNTLPRQEAVAINEWWWSGSCEYADIVYGVDSWMEFKFPDMTASNTNPFLQVFARTPLRRNFPTVSDLETYVGVAEALATLTGDQRFADYRRFVKTGEIEVYLQRILDASPATLGYEFRDLEAMAQAGIPALMNTRTYPRTFGWEQVHESKPWYTKTGRLEFYRGEPEFIEAGENLVVHREPVDSTFYDPNVIVARPHPAIRPKRPEDYGFSPDKRDANARMARNAVRTPEDLLATPHPLLASGYRYVFHTPKYRHGSHTTPIDTDIMSNFFGPFGDMYRRDKRSPHVGEAYVDVNPDDARALGINDGDDVYVDGDPADNPFRGWQAKGREAEAHVARLLCRARYYPGAPREAMCRLVKAEDGGIGGKGLWRPVVLGLRPTNESPALERYLAGGFAVRKTWVRSVMATVFNWQIGREMGYPYEQARLARQFAVVLDTNRCIACQTCTVACKTTWTPGRGQEYMFWKNVETKPYGYYPLGWDVKILEQLGVQDMDGPVYAGKTLFEAAPRGEVVLGYPPRGPRLRPPEHRRGRQRGRPHAAGGVPHAAAHAVDVLHAPHLQPLHVRRLPLGLPAPVDLQAAGGRDRPARPDPLPRLPRVRAGLPVQEGVLQRRDAGVREVHRLLPGRGGRAADAVHHHLHREDPAAGLHHDARQAEPREPAGLPDPRGEDRAAALPAVRSRAGHLLHPAGPRAAGLPPALRRLRGGVRREGLGDGPGTPPGADARQAGVGRPARRSGAAT